MAYTSYFARTYSQARERFVAAAKDAGASLSSFLNERGVAPDGAELRTDVAWIGPPEPASVLVLVSGTHGVEGFCGSACQIEFLKESIKDAPAETAFLVVHALNPHGFAYERRVNEDNIDLNRNFVDHADPPHNDDYDEIHAALVPDSWTGPARIDADRLLARVADERGVRHLQEAVTLGQYRHPDGLFYGGTEPAWSHRLLQSIVRKYLPGIPRVAYIDLHTGPGTRGHGEPIFHGGLDDHAVERARSWYGDELTMSKDRTSSSAPTSGDMASLVAGELEPGQELTAITLEFGTLPSMEVLDALRADNWLRLQADADLEIHSAIKHQIRQAFYPSACEWRSAVLARAKEVFRQAFSVARPAIATLAERNAC
jgi:predicted deacylase